MRYINSRLILGLLTSKHWWYRAVVNIGISSIFGVYKYVFNSVCRIVRPSDLLTYYCRQESVESLQRNRATSACSLSATDCRRLLHSTQHNYQSAETENRLSSSVSEFLIRIQAVARIADRTASQHLWRSRDVIGQVTIWYSMCHFLLMVLWNQASISNGFRDIQRQNCNVMVDVTLIRPLNKG